MNWLSKVIRKQGQSILHNDVHALFNTLMLAILPYTGWLASSVVALITLRKGAAKGGQFLIVAVLIHFFIMRRTPLSTTEALLSALLSYVPCYIAAVTLYSTVHWRWVSIAFFLQVLLMMCIVQMFVPEFVTQQYLYIREILDHFQFGDTLHAFIKTMNPEKQAVFAHYLLGTQAAGIMLSSLISLAFARFVQSLLYYPGGFKQEMRTLRGKKTDLLLLASVLVASQKHIFLAIDVLPVLLLFFFMSGISLWYDCTTNRGFLGPTVAMSVVLFFFPYIILPIYVMFGSLDTLFNFRMYLQNRADTKIREVK